MCLCLTGVSGNLKKDCILLFAKRDFFCWFSFLADHQYPVNSKAKFNGGYFFSCEKLLSVEAMTAYYLKKKNLYFHYYFKYPHTGFLKADKLKL